MTPPFVIVMAATLAAVTCQDWYRVRRGGGDGGSSASASSSTFAGAGAGGSPMYPDYGYGGGAYHGVGYPGFGYPGVGYSGAGYHGGGFNGAGFPGVDFSAMLQAYQRALMEFQAAAAHAAQQAQRGESGVGTGTGGVGASASGSLGPQGGRGSAQIYPESDDGLSLRFGEPDTGGQPVNSVGGGFPAPAAGGPGGGSYGVFSSSSSGQTSVDGKTKSFKTATVGVNDNGRISTYTAHDP